MRPEPCVPAFFIYTSAYVTETPGPTVYTGFMRVAIDIRRINEFGVGTYTRNAIRTLARLDDVNEYFLLGIPGKLGDIEPLPPNFTAVPAHPKIGRAHV